MQDEWRSHIVQQGQVRNYTLEPRPHAGHAVHFFHSDLLAILMLHFVFFHVATPLQAHIR